jgi:mevalonate kinase
LNISSWHSNGKLLLTGEYLVLFGAEALALPTSYGQSILFEEIETPEILWTSEDPNGTWFEAAISLPGLNIIRASDEPVAARLVGFLEAGFSLTKGKIPKAKGYKIHTHADFNRHWGLGTSSTLIVNMARWLDISPWDLYWKTFKGSGFDIACAMADGPILYKLENGMPVITPVEFSPPFADEIYFIYTGKKMDTQKSVSDFRKSILLKGNETEAVSKLTRQILRNDSGDQFMVLLEEHEQWMSSILKLPTVKKRLFPDFEGCIKSLGAWGGDFILAMSPGRSEYVKDYFSAKGYRTSVPYGEMIL